MTEYVLDVNLEFDLLKLAAEPDPTRAVAEASRVVAEEQAAAVGGTLRHPDPREVVTRRAIKPETGQDVYLVATRWLVDA